MKPLNGGKQSRVKVLMPGWGADMEKARQEAGQPQAGSVDGEEHRRPQRQQVQKSTKHRPGGQVGSSACYACK